MRKNCDDSGVKSTPRSPSASGLAAAGRGPERRRSGRARGSSRRRVVDEHEAARPGPGQWALRDPRDERGRDAGVDGVPAVREHLGPRLGGERMPCCDRAPHRRRLLGPAEVSSPSRRDRGQPARPREATLSAGAAGALCGRCSSGSARPDPTSRRTRTSARCSSTTASRSGTTSGTRAATASSPTASSTTRSPRCSGSGCSRSRPSRRRRSRSRSCVWREWGPTTRWSSRTFAVVWAGIVFSAAFPFALGAALGAARALGAPGAEARGASPCSRR